MNFEKLLHELRLMKDQPRDRYYSAWLLVLLVMMRGVFTLGLLISLHPIFHDALRLLLLVRL